MLVITNFTSLIALGGLMSTQADLVQAVSDLDTAITALENKPDSTPGTGNIDQAVLDKAVADIQSQRVRVDAETAKK